MEILAVHTSYTAALVAIAFVGSCICFALFPFFTKSTINAKVIGASVIALGIGMIVVVSANPAVTTYKVRVSDWNVVYNEGYSVIDIDDDIVTLKKNSKERTKFNILPPSNDCKCFNSDDPMRTRRRDDGQLKDEEEDEE